VFNTFQISPISAFQNEIPTWDSGLSLAVTGTYLGTASSTICSIFPTSGSTAAASCTGYSDYNAAVTFARFLSSAGTSNLQWENAARAASSTTVLTTGGSIYNVNYYKLSGGCLNINTANNTLGGAVNLLAVGLIVIAAITILSTFTSIGGKEDEDGGSEEGNKVLANADILLVVVVLLIIGAYLFFSLSGSIGNILAC
jgi:hypothetical protein